MLPLIGLTVALDYERNRSVLSLDYWRAVERAGGIPVLLPTLESEELGKAVLERLDGILLTGGVDVDPWYYGQLPMRGLGSLSPERDWVEIALAREALERGVPLLAICRGIQVLNVAAGGTLYQDLATQVPDSLNHWQRAPRWHPTHPVRLSRGSRIRDIMGAEEVRVNTFHHQAIKDLAPGFTVTGRAPDGVIEAIEAAEHAFALGIQWHAEGMWEKDHTQLGPFRALVEAARERRQRG